MSKGVKKILAVVVVIIIGVAIYYMWPKGHGIATLDDFLSCKNTSADFGSGYVVRVGVHSWDPTVAVCAAQLAVCDFSKPFVITDSRGLEGPGQRALEYSDRTVLIGTSSLSGVSSIHQITGDNPSSISVEIAKKGWSHIESVVVVETYEEALLLSPMASLTHSPILINGEHTRNFLESVKPKVVLASKNLPINQPQFVVDARNLSGIYLDALEMLNQTTNYAVVVNPTDAGRASDYYVPYSSICGVLLAVYHQGIIIIHNNTLNKETLIAFCEKETEKDNEYVEYVNKPSYSIDKKLNQTVLDYKSHGFELKNIAIIGDAAAVPFRYAWGEEQESYVATQLFYASVNNDLHADIAVGRLTGTSIESLSTTIYRLISYPLEFDNTNTDVRDPIENTNYALTGESVVWKDRALVWECFFERAKSSVMARHFEQLLESGGYDVTRLDKPRAAEWEYYIDDANIVVLSSHGNPYCSGEGTDTTRISADEIRTFNLPQQVYFCTGCSSGRIDVEDPENTFTTALFYAGMVGYLGSTRGSPGDAYRFSPSTDPEGSQLVGMLFVESLVQGKTIGDGYLNFVNNYDSHCRNFTIQEYTLYGDPAFNPYEPSSG